MVQIRSIQRLPFSRLGAELDLSEQHPVTERALRRVVRGVYPRDFAERPERVVLVQQAGAEPAGLQMPATDTSLEQRLDLLAVRRSWACEPGEVVTVLEILAVAPITSRAASSSL